MTRAMAGCAGALAGAVAGALAVLVANCELVRAGSAASSSAGGDGPAGSDGAGPAAMAAARAVGGQNRTAARSAPVPARWSGRGGGAATWLKGSTHVHTANSGDSKVAVEDVVRWYRDRGYDFIVITDHNRVTHHTEAGGPPLVLEGIELTHNPETCDPPPPEPDGKCRIHLNGLGLGEAALDRAALAGVPQPIRPGGVDRGVRPPAVDWKNATTTSRIEMYQAGIDQVRRLGGIVQVNHPSWHWGVDGVLLAELGRRGAVLVEVANMGFARWNAGSEAHPSAEAVWDEALSQGVLIFGVASDDAHDYDEAVIEEKRTAGVPVYPAGTGWVMVRAAREPDAIRRALARGEFYASTGVFLDRADVADGAMQIDVAAPAPGEHEIVFVGQGGEVLARTSGRSAQFALADAPPGYLRAVVSRNDGARAWVQPVPVPQVLH